MTLQVGQGGRQRQSTGVNLIVPGRADVSRGTLPTLSSMRAKVCYQKLASSAQYLKLFPSRAEAALYLFPFLLTADCMVGAIA
mmetsp:Transcript_10546/g.15279  ORF Transcript_10546/g.15279 Transcript_10546/m.15279 type:complete len:83 (-) Transcript_10546:597-845(-)